MPLYEFNDEKSHKFWEITTAGSDVTARWGKIGTTGQSKTKSFGDAGAAQKDHDKQVASKVKKGYELISDVSEEAGSSALRYEFKDEKSHKFWEVMVEGCDVIARWGRVGSSGQSKTKSFDDANAAQKDCDKQAAAKVKKGYELVSGGTPASSSAPGVSNPELESGIANALDDVDGYLVYGDWLQSEGQPLGELVSIQHALASKPGDKALRKSELSLLKANLAYFFGPEQVESENKLSFEKIESWKMPSAWGHSEGWRYGHVTSFWENGFVKDLIFHTGYWGDDEFYGKDAALILEKVLALPGSRFIQRISIGEIWMDDDYEGPNTTFAVDAITASPCAAILREFIVSGGDHDLNGVSLNASSLWKSCPNLEKAVLYAGQLSLGTINTPKLRSFAVQTGGLDKNNMTAIVKAKWPCLEELEIWFGDDNYGGDCTFADLKPLLRKKDLKLKKLGIKNMEFGDEVCAAIVKAPILASLEELDLTMGVIGDEGAKSLIENKDKLSHLKKLSVAGYFADSVAAQLKGIIPNCEVDTRGPPDDEYRYVEVSE